MAREARRGRGPCRYPAEMIHEFTTSRCASFGHAEFRFKVDDARVIEPDVTWFTKTLEDWVSEGARFSDGETIQIGWGLMKVRAASDRTLNLLEPDYESMPIEWVDTVSSTLVHLRLQKDVSQSFFDSDATNFPSLRFHGIVCSQLKVAEGIVMERFEGTPPDSGWFIGCDDDDHHQDSSELIRISLYEAVLRNPKALSFLALPVGTSLGASSDGISLYFGDELLPPKQGSYIEQLLAKSAD